MKKIIFSALVAAVAFASSCTKIIQETYYQEVVRDSIIVISGGGDGYTAMRSVQDFGVLPTNTARVNKENLQVAINWAANRGAALYVEPVDGGYPMNAGLELKKGVSLIGAHGPTGRGTINMNGDGPTGSVFVIKDDSAPFITVNSATQIKGIQFYYPNQPYAASAVANIKTYPPTIQMNQNRAVTAVTLTDLTFYGETFAMDFRGNRATNPCEQILIENCYGYPLSGQFIAIDHCYDIPRILHCHVNPANQREFGRGYPSEFVDYVVNQKNYAYHIEHTDNAQLMDVFTFGSFGGIYLGASTYGQLTNFNLDCVSIGIYKDGDGPFNRVWEVAQGSIIANLVPTGGTVEDIHPIYVTGRGHLSLANVDCFSGSNGGKATCIGKSYDFIKVEAERWVVVTGVNCRMRNYVSDFPITYDNCEYAQISFLNCANKDGNLFDFKYIGPHALE